MVRVKFIPTDNGREIAFFPDSRKLFFVDDNIKGLIEDLSAGKEKDYILKKHGISSDEYDGYLAVITDPAAFAPPPETDGKKVQKKLALHLANGCNLRCVYCYANGGVYRSGFDLMTKEVLDRTIDVFYREYDHIDQILFFGGEPLLNMDMMEYACEKIQEIERSRGSETEFGVVTNGTLINERFVELVKKYHISVTVSFDGDIAINDRMRIFPNGAPTSELILKKIQMLREAEGQPNGIQATYTQYHMDAGITPFELARRIREIVPGVEIQLVPASGTAPCPYVPKDISGFPAAVAEYLDARVRDPNAEPPSFFGLEDAINCVTVDHPPKRTKLCEACAGTLAVSTKGDIYPCYVLMDHKEVWLGSVFEEDVFHTDHYQETARQFMKHNCKENLEECRDCVYNHMCAHCIGHDEQMAGKLFELDARTCEMQRAMFEEAIKGIAKLYEKEKAK